MNKGLKIAMTAYGIGGALFGLSYLLIPDRMSEIQGAEVLTSFLTATKMTLGASLVAVGVFAAIAARDPIRNILWVRFTIVFATLFLGVAIYSGAVLFEDMGEAAVGWVIHGTFAVALLALYPWHNQADLKPTSSRRPPAGGES